MRHTLTGYVSDDLRRAAARFGKPDDQRTVDVGYRGRPLPPYLGRGGQEKDEIGRRFRELAAGTGLRLDIKGAEADRLYGDAWYRFIANCRCVLGVESGRLGVRPRGRGASTSTASSSRAASAPTSRTSRRCERWDDVVD